MTLIEATFNIIKAIFFSQNGKKYRIINQGFSFYYNMLNIYSFLFDQQKKYFILVIR